MIRTGNAGNDDFLGGFGKDYLSGLDGDDRLNGAGGDDYLYGGDGRDLLIGGEGADRLFGNDGDDYFFTGNSLDAAPGPGDDAGDTVDGGIGFDVVDYRYILAPTAKGVTIDLADSSRNAGLAAGDRLSGIEGVFGSYAADDLRGNDVANVFFATIGANDVIDGRRGIDEYRAHEASGPAGQFSLQIAFGAVARQLGLLAGITVPRGSGIALYDIWVDANDNQVVDAGEQSYRADLIAAIESLVGTGRSDRILGSNGNDVIEGGSYTDPGLAADRLDGADGFDYLSYAHLATGITIDLAQGTAAKLFTLGGFPIVSDTVANFEGVIGSDYADQVVGASIGEIVFGGKGTDALEGAGGADLLDGGMEDDILIGGAGDDVLVGGAGRDVLDGGAGIDTVSYADAETSVAARLDTGNGRLPIIDGEEIDDADSVGDIIVDVENLVGSTWSDIFTGSDVANVIEGRDGKDILYGRAGDDLLYGEAAPNPSAPLRGADFGLPRFGEIIVNDPTDEEYDGPYNIAQSDLIFGGAGRDRIFGGLGQDIISGDDDADTIDGGEGSDIVYGGTGNDLLSGSAGFDLLIGGVGFDTIDYTSSPGAVRIDLSAYWRNAGGDAAGDALSEILANLRDPQALINNLLFIALVGDTGSTDDNPDFVAGIPDVTVGVEGAIGSVYADEISGDVGDNRLDGSAGDDMLSGRAGNDVLIGGAGADVMTGGAGNDRFVFTAGDVTPGSVAVTAGVITDFDRTTRDRIDLSEIDAIAETAGDDRFILVGEAAFSGRPGEIRVVGGSGGALIVSGDVNGDAVADFAIDVFGTTMLTAANFVL